MYVNIRIVMSEVCVLDVSCGFVCFNASYVVSIKLISRDVLCEDSLLDVFNKILIVIVIVFWIKFVLYV